MTDKLLTDAEIETIDGTGVAWCTEKTFTRLVSQAKRANSLESECERLRKENGEYNGDVAEATAQYNFQLNRAESAERRLAVAVGALKEIALGQQPCDYGKPASTIDRLAKTAQLALQEVEK